MNVADTLKLAACAAVLYLAVRRVLSKISYHPSRIEQSGETWIFVLARDAFRTRKNLDITKDLADRIIAAGAKRVIIDLSSVQPGFFDDGVFGVLASLWQHTVHDLGGRVVFVKPPDRVYRSYEYEPFRHATFATVQNIQDGLGQLNQVNSDFQSR